VASSVIPHPSPTTPGNVGAPADLAGLLSERERGRRAPSDRVLRSPLLAKLTGVTSVAIAAAAGLIVVGILAVLGGAYDRQVVSDQLVPQKIFFPAPGSPGLLPGIKQYAGQQLVNGDQARAYANNFIAVHLSKIAAGQTYAQVSAASLAAPSDAKLASEKAALFQGETLRGLLLGAWGWAMVGAIATIAGILLIALGAVLLVLPLANWQVNLRGRSAVARRA
jgi:hypothetical protein